MHRSRAFVAREQPNLTEIQPLALALPVGIRYAVREHTSGGLTVRFQPGEIQHQKTHLKHGGEEIKSESTAHLAVANCSTSTCNGRQVDRVHQGAPCGSHL